MPASAAPTLGLLIAVAMAWPLSLLTHVADAGQAQVETVANPTDYFPDAPGSSWRYRGEVTEGPVQKVATRGFVNVSTVTGSEMIRGVKVTVFHDTNPGNHGPSESYYRRDAAGIVYYGSEPGTTLEKQLIPYQIVRFPIQMPSSFEQFNKTQLDFGSDLDGDEKNEEADVQATVTVVGAEPVSVPAGSYPDAIRIEANMTLRIHLSDSERVAIGTDTMVAWFARGVGLVKYVERQQIPPFKSDRGWVSEITEELEAVTINPNPEAARESKAGRKAPPDRIFAHDSRGEELLQVVVPPGLRSDTR